MPNCSTVCLVFASCTLLFSSAQAAEWHVPADYATIQAAIDAAANGDTILVADGTYTGSGNRYLSFKGKSLTIRGANGALHCILDCASSVPGFSFSPSEPQTVTIEGLTIARAAPGVEISGSASAIIRDCIIRDCTRSIISDSASGLDLAGVSATVERCLIAGNSGYSGGIRARGNVTISNCRIVGNEGISYGGGINGRCTVTHCLISGNWGPCGPSGYGGDGTVVNSIVWGNSPGVQVDSRAQVSYSCVQSGAAAGIGNISLDPLLDTTGGTPHLTRQSPCIDAGTAGVPLPSTDYEGGPRVLDGNGDGVAAPDIGPDEVDMGQPRLVVGPASISAAVLPGDTSAFLASVRNIGGGTMVWTASSDAAWLQITEGSGDSSGELDHIGLEVHASDLAIGDYSALVTVMTETGQASLPFNLHVGQVLEVPSQYTTIQAGVDAAGPGDTVLLADGTYSGTGNVNIDFKGKAIVLRSANGPAACSINGGYYGVKFQTREGPGAVLDGLTIQNTTMAVYCQGASPSIRNCVIWQNAYGVRASDSSVNVQSCVIEGNTNGSDAIYFGRGSPSIVNCRIARNSGPIQFTNSVGALLANCLLVKNSGLQGGIVSSSGLLQVSNCTVIKNSPVVPAFYSNSSTVTLSNCIFWGDGPQIGADTRRASRVSVSYCDILGGAAGVDPKATGVTLGPGIINADPLFVDPDGPDNDPNTWADNDYRLKLCSPVIDAGNDAEVPRDLVSANLGAVWSDPLSVDLSGGSRFIDSILVLDTGKGVPPIVDMGAYEFAPPPPPPAVVDLDHSGSVEPGDFDKFLAAFGHSGCDASYNGEADLDADGTVTLVDYQMWLRYYQSAVGNPQASPPLEVLGDFQRDGHVDDLDLEHIAACQSGAGVPQTEPACQDADLDGDADVDQDDFGVLQRCATGPGGIDLACKY